MKQVDSQAQSGVQSTEAKAESPQRCCCGLWRWIGRGFAVVGFAWVFSVATPFAGWLFEAMDAQDELQKADYILCLGGNPSRVLESVRLLQEGYAPVIVVSNHDEAARQMRDLAIDWGATPDQIIVDDAAWKTLDHPRTIQARTGLDPEKDKCIIVTSYTHMARSKACFEHAGYRHVILREPKWEREFRGKRPDWLSRFLTLPHLIYECAAWTEYWFRGAV